MSQWAYPRTSAVIDLAALKHNLDQVRSHAPTSRVMAVIKANAYGHGAARVAHALDNKVDGFAVSSVLEGIALREHGIQSSITILSSFDARDEVAALSDFDLIPVIHSTEQLHGLLRELNRSLDAWLKVDTGMHRMGLTTDEYNHCSEKLNACKHVREIRLMSHLANADDLNDDYTHQQLRYFLQHTSGAGQRSLANSAGILAWPGTHLDWVRPGLMLYGASPLKVKTAKELNLKPVMTFKSKLIAIKQLNKGDAIGYGGDWICPETMRVGVVVCGYGDGYPRHIDRNTHVLLNEKRTLIVGRVSMDVMSIDLRKHTDARVGDEVVLWGDELPVDEIAQHAETIPYELLTSVSSRVPHIEINGG